MSRKLIVALAVISFALTGAVFAAVENIKVSGDIHAEAFVRDFALGKEGNSDNDHESLFSQIRLRFDADLTEGVSAVLRFLSEAEWGEDSDDDLEVDLAYIELKEFLYQPLTVKVGRQELRYGNALIVGNPDTNQGKVSGSTVSTGLPTIVQDLSIHKSFDSVKAVLDYAPWTIDLVFAQIDEGSTNDRRDDEHMYGINAAYDWDSYNGISELYFFKGDSTPRSTHTTDTKDHVYVTGVRTQFDPTDKITVGLEGAYQFGDYRKSDSDHRHRRAFAAQAMAEYRFLNDYNAKIGTSFTYLQGDDPNTSRYEEWEPMWEDQTPAEIINVLMSNANAYYFTLSGSMMPKEDITLGLLYCHAMLDKKVGSTSYSPSMGPAKDLRYSYTVKANKRNFGDEFDIYGIYDYTEDVQIKLSGAFFVPGNVFEKANDNTAYSLRAGMTVNF